MSKVGGDGPVRFTATTDEERELYRLSQQEVFHLQLQGNLTAEALLRFPTHHGIPSLAELGAHFARSPLVSAALASALARSIWSSVWRARTYRCCPAFLMAGT